MGPRLEVTKLEGGVRVVNVAKSSPNNMQLVEESSDSKQVQKALTKDTIDMNFIISDPSNANVYGI